MTKIDIYKQNLLNLNEKEINNIFIELKEKPFRTKQIFKWIYQKYCTNIDNITNFNYNLKEKLKKKITINIPKIKKTEYSTDGTIKWYISITKTDHHIETIYIPNKKRATLCISSQIGCILKCTFCATGKSGFIRNLQTSEIISQIWLANYFINKNNKQKKKYNPITNIVIMGMGEPLLNLKNIISSLKIINCKLGFNIPKKKIILSTSGIVPAINKLNQKIKNIPLAISLHAPNNNLRNKIMPINNKYNIYSLLQAIKKYSQNNNIKNKKITIEYIMINNINDRNKHAYQLCNILKNIPCKINLIPYNSFNNSKYTCSKKNKILQFFNILTKKGFITTIRKNRGTDIHAACGQLTGNISKKNK